MRRSLPVVVLVALLAGGPAVADDEAPAIELEVTATLEPSVLVVDVELVADLPAETADSVASGAPARVSYPIRVSSRRRAWFDDRIWRGDLDVTAAFDAVTGRYTCEAILDGAIVERREVGSAEQALAWLTSPPPVRLSMPERYDNNTLRVRARAVFSRSTTWLIFPSVDSTHWVELELPPRQEGS